jgi:hypothetical protein
MRRSLSKGELPMTTKCFATFVCESILSGCASIVSGSKDEISLDSVPSGAEFVVKDGKGTTVGQGTTPTKLKLERGEHYFSGKSYDIQFSNAGCMPQEYPMESSLNPWYIGNVIIGGVLGWLLVDPLTGAMWRVSEEVNVHMVPIVPAAHQNSTSTDTVQHEC